ncbi:cytochrome b/b6 domain-containing protein [Muricoccus vinaceus]|uniref:Cytochrome b/b6 domain-containing protein n=1 Tax=Muricoccus vinaceus TaxID=424704 RepID=A0ABV6IWM1_9PROT
MPEARQVGPTVPGVHAITTRLAHPGVVTIVAAQLATSSVMTPPPRDGGGAGDLWFAAHTLLGLGAVAAVMLVWLAMLARPAGGTTPRSALFPWFSARRRIALAENITRVIRRIRAGRLPHAADTSGALAPAVHGLGLLVLSAVVVTGFLGWYGGFRALLAAHPVFTTLLWVYLSGHVGFALLHQGMGEGRLGYMFLAWRRDRQGTRL